MLSHQVFNQERTHDLFYGPRLFGSNSIDFPIFEKNTPKKAFAFVPDETKTFFVTNYPELVKFNGEKIKKAEIKSGDRILIGNTTLKLTLK